MNEEDYSSKNGVVARQTGDDMGVEPQALKRLYDGIYAGYGKSDDTCKVSTGSLRKARKRIRQVLRGFGLTSAFPNVRVLDVGCGLGFSAQAFYELGASVTAMDLSEIAIDRAQAQFKGIDFRCAAFPDGLTEKHAFDLVWAVDLPLVGVFEQGSIKSDFLQLCLELLKADGHLVVGWHTNFSGQMINGWMHWSIPTMREFQKTFRSSPALVPQLGSLGLSTAAFYICRFVRRSIPVCFVIRATDWHPPP
jgi:SAM-dependent methyltransferase